MRCTLETPLSDFANTLVEERTKNVRTWDNIVGFASLSVSCWYFLWIFVYFKFARIVMCETNVVGLERVSATVLWIHATTLRAGFVYSFFFRSTYGHFTFIIYIYNPRINARLEIPSQTRFHFMSLSAMLTLGQCQCSKSLLVASTPWFNVKMYYFRTGKLVHLLSFAVT